MHQLVLVAIYGSSVIHRFAQILSESISISRKYLCGMVNGLRLSLLGFLKIGSLERLVVEQTARWQKA